MKERRWASYSGLVLALAASFALMGTAGAADEHPEGCVDCHVQRQGTTDLRLNALLDQIGHPRLRRVKQVPRDCIRCHTPEEGTDEVPFSSLVHAIHFDVPATNTFVTIYGGKCTQCHVMDAEEGEAHVKVGPVNW